ncbi:MAG: SUF system NifU family Fe-S cluster assembly protein [bacterium]
MDNLETIYQQVINDHNINPFNYYKMAEPTHYAKGANPSRGDEVEVYLKIEDDTIKECSFVGGGGAVFSASCSIMMTIIEGKTTAEALIAFEKFVNLLTNPAIEPNEDIYGKMVVFAGIRKFPARVKCASLPWFTMKAAIEGTKETVSTEFIM